MEMYLSPPGIPLWYGLGQFVITFCKLFSGWLESRIFWWHLIVGLELCGLWLELVLGCFEPLGSMMGRGSLSVCTNNNISGRTALWCWLLVWVVWIAACTEMFSELNCHSLSVCIKWGWNKTWLVFVCLFVCFSQIYRLWWLLIISVATYPVLRAVHPAIASVPILASIQGVPKNVDSHAHNARWELVYGSFVHHTFYLPVTLCTHVHTIDIKASTAMVVI